MAEKSGIQWTQASFSPWWGCVEIPEVEGRPGACTNCYARTLAHRWGHEVWGKDAPRKTMSEHYWNDPIRWNRKAQKTGKRLRVFCAPMADVFEDRRDLDPSRERLWDLIIKTPMLDWLLLTKRPWLMRKFTPDYWVDRWPSNIWAGTTTEDQHWFDHRMDALSRIPAKIRFVSAEPLFQSIDISKYSKYLDWVITGSESGWKARLTEESWIRSLKEQCVRAGIPFFYKQFTMPDKTVIHTPELDGRTWLEVPDSPAVA